MLRPVCSALVLFSVAACASGGTPSSEPGAQTKRTTTMVTTMDGLGRVTSTPITTYEDVGGKSADIDAAPDDVFRVLGEAYSEVGIQPGTIDPARRVVGNAQIQMRRRLGRANLSTYLECGQTGLSGPAADSYPIRMSVMTTVTPAGGASRISTTVQGGYVASEQSGVTQCTSTGALETLIARAVQLRLARG
jgi:hypothetical protein